MTTSFAAAHESAPGADFQLLHCTKSRRDPGTADMTDGLSGLNSGAHDPISAINPSAEGAETPQCSSLSVAREDVCGL